MISLVNGFLLAFVDAIDLTLAKRFRFSWFAKPLQQVRPFWKHMKTYPSKPVKTQLPELSVRTELLVELEVVTSQKQNSWRSQVLAAIWASEGQSKSRSWSVAVVRAEPIDSAIDKVLLKIQKIKNQTNWDWINSTGHIFPKSKYSTSTSWVNNSKHYAHESNRQTVDSSLELPGSRATGCDLDWAFWLASPDVWVQHFFLGNPSLHSRV